MKHFTLKCPQRVMRGSSMIEVMVTTVILALGIMGTSALQIIGLKGTDSAHYRTVATFLANEMAERMRTNPEGVTSGDYETDADNAISCSTIAITTLNCSDQLCTPSQLALFDQTQLLCGHVKKTSSTSNWLGSTKAGIINSLPNGSLTIDCGVNSCGSLVNHNITIAWTERVDSAGQDPASSNIVLSIIP